MAGFCPRGVGVSRGAELLGPLQSPPLLPAALRRAPSSAQGSLSPSSWLATRQRCQQPLVRDARLTAGVEFGEVIAGREAVSVR